jgi:ABC-type lipoprotein release transport system permease subunit
MFLSAAGMLLAVVMVAAYLPARRAAHGDPGVILRQN